MLKKIKTKHPDIFFIISFLLLFSILYFGTQFWIGITSKGNYYNAFCDNYFNYILWLRISILKASVMLSNLLGYKAAMLNNISIVGFNDYKVNMVYSCIGYGIFSFWIAFVTTFPYTHFNKKIYWLLGGVFLIWLINVCRISLLLIMVNTTKNVQAFSHHHLMYNIFSYIIIFILIHFFIKQKKQIT